MKTVKGPGYGNRSGASSGNSLRKKSSATARYCLLVTMTISSRSSREKLRLWLKRKPLMAGVKGNLRSNHKSTTAMLNDTYESHALNLRAHEVNGGHRTSPYTSSQSGPTLPRLSAGATAGCQRPIYRLSFAPLSTSSPHDGCIFDKNADKLRTASIVSGCLDPTLRSSPWTARRNRVSAAT